MNDEVKERVAKLVDPQCHFAFLAADLRDAIKEVNEAYAKCLKYGMVGDFYIGPGLTLTHLPDFVKLRRTEVTHY